MSTAKNTIIICLFLTAVFTSCSDDKKTSPSDQPQGIQFIGQYNTPDHAIGVIVDGNYAYVADHDSGMQIINISNPSYPVFAGNYQCPGALQIDLKGDHAYIADETLYSLEIVDISDPESPDFVGRYDIWEVLGIRIFGDYAIMGCGSDGLQVINIADPTNPSFAGSCMDVELMRFELAGNYALVPGENGFAGLFTVSLSNISNPGVFGSIPTGGTPFEIAVKDNYAYMTNLGDSFSPTDTGYLYIFDISNMASPQKIDSLFLGNAVVADFVYDNYLYVTFVNADATSGFHVIDISNPIYPEVTTTRLLNVMPWDIWVESDYIYIASDTAGLMIYRYYP